MVKDKLKLVLALLAWLGFSDIVSGQGQQAYMIVFADKANNGYSINRPSEFLSPRSLSRRGKFGISILERDLPVTRSYVDSIRRAGYAVLSVSKWFNAALVQTDAAGVQEISGWSFVAGSRRISYNDRPDARISATCLASQTMDTISDFGIGRNQAAMLGIDSMHADGYKGEGIHIAVMDAGFLNVPGHAGFQHLLQRGTIASAQDFVSPPMDVYRAGVHGGWVLSCIGGYYPGFFVGGSYKSTFHLFRTEDESSETERECFYWAAAAERADSLGVDLINTSLGYSVFNDTSLSYRYPQLDGNTTLIARAVNIATETGMLCVSSAGNEGNNPGWAGKITSPADARLGLTVGALSPDSTLASFSSRGPAANGRIKPDVVAQGVGVIAYSASNPTGVSSVAGTSFSSPLTAGLMGGMMEAFPSISPTAWIEALHATSSRAARADTLYGYGIPNYGRLSRFIQDRLTGIKNKTEHPYTNPTNGPVIWRLPSANVLRLQAISTSGVRHLLNIKPGEDNIHTNVSRLAAGFYILQADMKDGTYIRSRIAVNR